MRSKRNNATRKQLQNKKGWRRSKMDMKAAAADKKKEGRTRKQENWQCKRRKCVYFHISFFSHTPPFLD